MKSAFHLRLQAEDMHTAHHFIGAACLTDNFETVLRQIKINGLLILVFDLLVTVWGLHAQVSLQQVK